MRAEDWTDVEAIFSAAIGVPPEERDALVAGRCNGRPDVHAEVLSLLASHDSAGTFLNQPDGPGAVDTLPREDLSGRMFGPFKLVEVAGRGGMSAVYRAERADGQFRQQVAVKVIDAPVSSSEVLRRFKAERQILAGLHHPHIVTLVDGGLSQDGRAYLAMELVDGVPITVHAAEHRLSLAERLGLMQRVCGAVQYAHRHAVVHRDLKPANILVTADGTPKVLDFGVAKLLEGDADAMATATNAPRPLTPNYASPEQMRGLPVTTASDIYALGVVLYELVTGVRPYDTSGKPLDEVLSIVTEREPRKPSAAVGAAADRRRLSGDIDAIVLKAMSKAPERRYASAQELAEDLGRWLGGQPVVAREPSLAYVLMKTARRHRAAFAAAAISTTALLVALGVSLWERHLAVLERNRATARFNDVRSIANALIMKLDSAVQPLPGSTPVRQQIVAEGLQYLERLSQDPTRPDDLTVEMAHAYQRIGDVQGNPSVPNLGDREGALSSYRKAIALLRPMMARPGSRDAALDVGRVDLSLANTAAATGHEEEARAATEDAVQVAQRLLQMNERDEAARRLTGSAEFQMALHSPESEALAHWQRAGDVFAALLADKPDDPDRQRNVALVEKYLGSLYARLGDVPAALTHNTRAMQLDGQRLLANKSNRTAQFDLAIDLSNVAENHWALQHLDEAAAGFERSLAMRKQLAESDPKDVLTRGRVAYAHAKLAQVYGQMNRLKDSLDHARQGVEIGQSVASLDSADKVQFVYELRCLGEAEARVGHADAACQSYRHAQTLGQELLADGHLNSGNRRSLDSDVSSVSRHLAACGPAKAVR